jgi:Mg-chelatase subunit ChlD
MENVRKEAEEIRELNISSVLHDSGKEMVSLEFAKKIIKTFGTNGTSYTKLVKTDHRSIT